MDNSGQSTQVGFLIILGLVVLLGGVLQASQVPLEETNTEIQHENTVFSQFSDLSSTLSAPNDIESTRLNYIKMGARYNEGFIFITPLPKQHGLRPQGTVRVSDLGQFEINGIAEVYGSKSLKDYYSSRSSVSYEQNILTYSVNYNRYNDEFIYKYDNSVFYVEDEQSERNAAVSSQNIINNRTINVPLLGGRISDSSINRKKLYIDPVSTGGKPIQMNIQDGDLTIPTELDKSEWEYLLKNENMVNSVSSTSDGISIDIKDGNYNVQVSKVRLESDSSRNFDNTLSKAYIKHEPMRYSVENGENIEIRGTVRDKFNNPLPSKDVNINTLGETGNGEFLSSGSSDSTTIESNSKGKFKDRYITSSSDSNEIEFEFD